MVKQSILLKKFNFCVSRFIIASAVLLIAALYALVAKDHIKSPSFIVSKLNAAPAPFSTPPLVKVKTTKELIRLFDQHNYCLDVKSARTDVNVPTLYLETLPSDFAQNLTIPEKKELFMKVLLPLILKANHEIMLERTKLIVLKNLIDNGSEILDSQKAWLENLAVKYRVKKFTYAKLDTLVARVDTIPVAMALGQGIEEAGWGRSSAARNKNATHGVTLPSGVKAYESLMVSVNSYMRNLNANPAYAKMRKIRSELRLKNKNLCGVKMMDGLYHYSELRNCYIRKVKRHIVSHNLARFDGAQLKELPLNS